MATTPRSPRLLITGGRVIDPRNGVDDVRDLHLEGGRVVDSGAGVPAGSSERLDATGSWVIPGLVDLHVHLASEPNARFGHAMLARAGVTTALDLGGPTRSVLQTAADHGAGLTIASLESFGGPGRTSPTRTDVVRAFAAARAGGAIGLKLHVDRPVTPETTDDAIEAAASTGSWIAIHCGTTSTASDLTGLRETISIAAGRSVHVAHVNSYCRGAIDAPQREADEAVELIRSAPAMFAESYLSPWNGTFGGCRDGVPTRPRVCAWLEQAGHEPTERGLEHAIRAGVAAVVTPEGDDLVFATGDRGVDVWRAADTNVDIGFPINPFDARVRLARATDDAGFVIPALATDGGAYPRNVTLQAGIALVDLGGMTPSQLVAKASWAGASALGLDRKGHLGVGADADVAIVDPTTRHVVATIAAGVVIMRGGQVPGRGTRVLTTAEGRSAVDATGCAAVPYDPASSGLVAGSLRSSKPALAR